MGRFPARSSPTTLRLLKKQSSRAVGPAHGVRAGRSCFSDLGPQPGGGWLLSRGDGPREEEGWGDRVGTGPPGSWPEGLSVRDSRRCGTFIGFSGGPQTGFSVPRVRRGPGAHGFSPAMTDLRQPRLSGYSFEGTRVTAVRNLGPEKGRCKRTQLFEFRPHGGP